MRAGPLSLLLCLALSLSAVAEEGPVPSPQADQPGATQNEDRVQIALSTTKKPAIYGSLFLGMFKAAGESGKLKSDGVGYGYGLSLGYLFTPHLGMDGEFCYFKADYQRDDPTVLPGIADNDVEVASVALTANVRYARLFDRWRVALALGGGFIDSDLYAKEASSGGKSAVAGDNTLGYQVHLGIGYLFENTGQLELGFRRIVAEQDFGAYSHGAVDIGGDFYSVAFRSWF